MIYMKLPSLPRRPESSESARSHGGRNLLILGLSAALLSLITTSISLVIYHKSGDIYLDRSRPGFLPDKAETTQKSTTTEYIFPENSPVTAENLQKYLKALKKSTHVLDQLDSSFSPDPLSDQSLGIPTGVE